MSEIKKLVELTDAELDAVAAGGDLNFTATGGDGGDGGNRNRGRGDDGNGGDGGNATIRNVRVRRSANR